MTRINTKVFFSFEATRLARKGAGGVGLRSGLDFGRAGRADGRFVLGHQVVGVEADEVDDGILWQTLRAYIRRRRMIGTCLVGTP